MILYVGRFESEDPGAHGLNWFVYCDNNPTNRVDSSGKSSEDLTGPQMASSMLFDIGAVLTMAAWTACMTPCPPMAVAVMVGAAVIAFTLAFDFSGTETSISASVLRDVTGFAAAGASAYEIVNWFRASADMEDKMPVASGKVLAAAVTLYGMEVYGAVNAVDN